MIHFLRMSLVGLLIACCNGYVYQCEPGTDPTVCSVWNFRYQGDEKPLPVLNMSSGVKTVRFVIEQYYYEHRFTIFRYDAVLHSTILHNPIAVQAIKNRITELHMPTDLQMANFQYNGIYMVPTDSSKSYDLTYLDLMHNSLQDISNLTALVNLKTLNLAGNRISELNASIFTGMRNLSMLNLGRNRIHKIDFKIFPKGLTNLWLLRNGVSELNLAGVSLPALNMLDLENNGLKTIDLPELIAAFPALRVLPFAMNPMQKDEAERIVAGLNRRNVSHYFERSELECESDEYEVSNICFEDSVFLGRSVWKAFVLLVLTVILAAIFVGSVRWIWYQMRY